MKLVIIGYVGEISVEDGGCAKIAEVVDDNFVDGKVFVKLQSWSDVKFHPEFDTLAGKSVRVTIEVIGEEAGAKDTADDSLVGAEQQ